MIIISGDIGGTNARLKLNDHHTTPRYANTVSKYRNHDFQNFSDVISTFITNCELRPSDIDSVCLAVAGPIVDQTVTLTNLPWKIDAKQLQQTLGIEQVTLINDFEAVGYGIETLAPEDMFVLQDAPHRPNATKAVIGPGTGLGVGLILNHQNDYFVVPTEGGHVDFSPTSDMQMALLTYLRKKYHRVSAERVVSGLGIEAIYKFVRDNPMFSEKESDELRFAIHAAEKDIAPIISEYALQHHDPVALRVLDVFIKSYASVAGNLALTTLPYGGLYLVGNITTQLLEPIADGRFIERFCEKGRLSELLKDIPIRVVQDTQIGLNGAANFALKQLNKS